ncbi:hypothetical protein [Microbacterium sp. 1P10AE]|uniref:hypothetical protein n=1 Tax=Microbacterium sp. 1P10AE TaxID=3132286 RepID=UPI0039A24292
MNVELSSLRIENEIGDGGFGVVHEVAGTPVPGDTRPMVLKRPKPDIDPVHVPAVLEGMHRAVAFRAVLSDADRQKIDEIAVWPVAMVVDQGREVGCLLPLIPPEFFMDIHPTNNIPGARKPRGYEYLSAPEQSRKNLGYDHPDYDDDALRLHVLAKLAGAVELLHGHGVVFGDLNPHNEVFTFSPARVLLLDCDAVGHVSDPTRAARQGHFPRWLPPEMSQGNDDSRPHVKMLQDFETDVYKLGLAFVRFIRGGKGATQRGALPSPPPPVVTSQLAAMIERALDPDPANRPTAGQLRYAAEDAVRTVIAPPVITHAGLSKPAALRGSDIIASWHIQSGSPYEVQISGPSGEWASVPGDRDSAPVRVPHAGQVVLHVRTRYDSATRVLGTVDCYELPPFHVETGALPAPYVPALPAFTAPSVLRDDIRVPLPAWPTSMDDLTNGAAELASTAPSMERLGFDVAELLRASGFDDLRADLTRSFPLPDALSLGSSLVAVLEEHLSAIMSAQALAFAEIAEELGDQKRSPAEENGSQSSPS